MRQSDKSRQVRRDAAVARPELRLTGTFFELATNPPPEGKHLSVRARDATGDYSIPFAVEYHDGVWHNAKLGSVIEVEIIKWRIWV
jgi:hypothetical protein